MADALATVQCLKRQLDESRITAELERLRAIDKLREEHREALKREQDYEREHVQSLTESFATEEAALKVKIEKLAREVETLSLSAVAPASASLPTMAMVTDDASSKHSASSKLDGTENTELDPNAAEYTPASAASAVSTSESTLAVTMAELIIAQTEALAAQTQAAAAQHLPPLKSFTGEGKLTDTDSFERWLESFEERAKLVGWNEAQQLHQLKLLLDRTALRAFRMFPEEDRYDLERTKEALKSRFKSTEIEELCGMEFHHKMQTTESVEELGLELQTLANKAFPSTPAKDFDRMLKGRFFQARSFPCTQMK